MRAIKSSKWQFSNAAGTTLTPSSASIRVGMISGPLTLRTGASTPGAGAYTSLDGPATAFPSIVAIPYSSSSVGDEEMLRISIFSPRILAGLAFVVRIDEGGNGM